MRSRLFLLTLLTGLGLSVLGFALTAPIGEPSGPEYSNPKMLFAPGVFVVGIILMFLSAAVYAVVPDSKK